MDHKDWDKHIPEIRYAINSAVHEVTGFSPSFLVFGRNIPIDGSYYGAVESTKNILLMPGDRKLFSEDLKDMSEIYLTVREKLHRSYERNSKSYNLRRRDVNFNIGDKVWRRNKVPSDAVNKFSAKLAPKYILCKIKRKVSRLVYGLETLDGYDVGNWHVQDFKPYYGSNSDVFVGSN